MTERYPYAELSVTTPSDTTIRASDGPESSDIELEYFQPEAPQLNNPSIPASEWKSALTPIGTFTLGIALAAGHHGFNSLINDKLANVNVMLSARITVPQDWVTRIGVGFSFAFKTALEATMAFALLQCLWLSVRRRPFTIKEIDTLYSIERSNSLYRTLPRALFFSPLLVFFSILTLLLPLSGVFAPGSLTVTTKNYTNTLPCIIPTGNLDNMEPEAPIYIISFLLDGWTWAGVIPSVTMLTTQWFVEQSIPDLPQACGLNCLYTVSVSSFVFECQPNPVSLPYGQMGGLLADPFGQGLIETLWNATTDPNSPWAFYVAWGGSGGEGTAGSAHCLPVLAQYEVKVRMTGGIQSVTTNVTQMTMPVGANLSVTSTSSADFPDFLGVQIATLSYATQALLLGNMTSSTTATNVNTLADQASFAAYNNPNNDNVVWGDVLTGIADMSHNVTAGLLSAEMRLGNMSAECSVDHSSVVYQYNSWALWVPYGIALGVTLVSLVMAIAIMMEHNTGQITTSFSDTIRATRRMEDVSESEKFRLGVVDGGMLEYSNVVEVDKRENVDEERDGPSL